MHRRHVRHRISSGTRWHKPRPPRTSAFGALVSSLEVLQSMEVPHCETSLTLSTFRYTFSFLLRIERIRSSPLEKLSPKSFSNDHIDPPPGEHYLRPVMNTVDVRFSRPFFRRPLERLVPPKRGNEPATALQQIRPQIST